MINTLLQAIPPVPPVPPEAPTTVIMGGGGQPWEPFMIALVVVASLVAAVKLLGPLVQALSRRVEGRTGDGTMQLELEELRNRIHELETQSGRVVELEERLDFAERLLAQGKERDRLPG